MSGLTEPKNDQLRPPHIAMNAVIRPFQPSDLAAVRAICCDTAFMGQPIDRFFSDREIFADALTGYYTDFEPENALIVEMEGRIAGYFFGCVNTARFHLIATRCLAPRLIIKGLVRGVLWRRGTRRLNMGVMRSAAAGHLKFSEPLPDFPSHLHLNLLEEYRGHGWGTKLMESGLARLRDAGAAGVHLQTMKQNVRAVEFFKRFGFQPYSETSADFWPAEVQPLTILSMARKL